MNIEEYYKHEGFEPEPATCIYCDGARFYRDLCVKHTVTLLNKLEEVQVVFSQDDDVVWFIALMASEQQIRERVSTIDDAIGHLHRVDNMSTNQVAKALDIDKGYVMEVLGNAVQ